MWVWANERDIGILPKRNVWNTKDKQEAKEIKNPNLIDPYTTTYDVDIILSERP